MYALDSNNARAELLALIEDVLNVDLTLVGRHELSNALDEFLRGLPVDLDNDDFDGDDEDAPAAAPQANPNFTPR
jgi:hypothetical protein